MVEGNGYCKKCGAFIPAWSDECLACGEPRSQRKKNVDVCLGKNESDSTYRDIDGKIHREPITYVDLKDVVDLNSLVLNVGKKPVVRYGRYRIKDAYATQSTFEMQPMGSKIVGKIVLEIVGDVI